MVYKLLYLDEKNFSSIFKPTDDEWPICVSLFPLCPLIAMGMRVFFEYLKFNFKYFISY
jgi:hypothetical protein